MSIKSINRTRVWTTQTKAVLCQHQSEYLYLSTFSPSVLLSRSILSETCWALSASLQSRSNRRLLWTTTSKQQNNKYIKTLSHHLTGYCWSVHLNIKRKVLVFFSEVGVGRVRCVGGGGRGHRPLTDSNCFQELSMCCWARRPSWKCCNKNTNWSPLQSNWSALNILMTQFPSRDFYCERLYVSLLTLQVLRFFFLKDHMLKSWMKDGPIHIHTHTHNHWFLNDIHPAALNTGVCVCVFVTLKHGGRFNLCVSHPLTTTWTPENVKGGLIKITVFLFINIVKCIFIFKCKTTLYRYLTLYRCWMFVCVFVYSRSSSQSSVPVCIVSAHKQSVCSDFQQVLLSELKVHSADEELLQTPNTRCTCNNQSDTRCTCNNQSDTRCICDKQSDIVPSCCWVQCFLMGNWWSKNNACTLTPWHKSLIKDKVSIQLGFSTGQNVLMGSYKVRESLDTKH